MKKKVSIKKPLIPSKRRLKAFKIRRNVALYYKERPLLRHPTNRDEINYPNKIANFSKALPHNSHGEVNRNAYSQYIKAIKSGKPNDFENITLGGIRKLVNPQAAFAFELIGPDSHQLVLPPPPNFSSPGIAGEMIELYWQALTRDVPFNEYNTNRYTIAAANELSKLSDFRGPKINGKVTSNTLFRENLHGAMIGPYISQFLCKDIPYVSTTIEQRYRTTVAGDDHLTSYEDWLAVQNGSPPPSTNTYDSTSRFIRNGRDLGEYVHNDNSIETGITACLILLSYGDEAIDPSNPYLKSKTQTGFPTFGTAYVLDFVAKSARPALEAAWYQKWLVHRRLRPEEFGGRIHNRLTGGVKYPINSEVLNSETLSLIYKHYGTYLLPQAYAEGCPVHPSYPAGHASFIGAMVTMLKAFFNESFVIPDPVIATSNGLSLVPYTESPLTVGGELNKLAYNIALGRNAAGVHFRTSGINGLYLGEAVAIGILRDYRKTYNENFNGFTFKRFNGKTIVI